MYSRHVCKIAKTPFSLANPLQNKVNKAMGKPNKNKGSEKHTRTSKSLTSKSPSSRKKQRTDDGEEQIVPDENGRGANTVTKTSGLVVQPTKKRTSDAEGGTDTATKKPAKYNYMKKDKPKPPNGMSSEMERVVQSTVDTYIFPYTKFVKEDAELEDSGCLFLTFAAAGLAGDNHETAAKRSQHWKAFIESMKSRLNDRRSSVIAAIKKAALGMCKTCGCYCELLYTYMAYSSTFLYLIYLSNRVQGGEKASTWLGTKS